jgi:glycosyltransferase involved in cell wall biosynthesis
MPETTRRIKPEPDQPVPHSPASHASMDGGLRSFPGRLAVQQRVLPAYRVNLFESLAEACSGGLSVYAGQSQAGEVVVSPPDMNKARLEFQHNRYLFSVSSPFCLVWQGGLLRWLSAWDPDALIVEANPRNLNTWRAVSWMHARRRPVLGWGLGVPALNGSLSALQKKIWRSFLISFDGWIAYSHKGASEYQAMGLPTERIFVAINAVMPRPQVPLLWRTSQYRERPTVLFVGRLQNRKRLDNLLSACAALPAPLQPRLWIVGEGPARAYFQAIAQKVYPQAEFLGARRGDELDPIFSTADLFVLPGTGGLAVQEAMAHGLPVVVAEGDGTQRDLVRPTNGWLVPPGNLDALTSALYAALSDINRLRQMGDESFRIVRDEVNLEQMIAVFINALDAVTPPDAQPRESG